MKRFVAGFVAIAALLAGCNDSSHTVAPTPPPPTSFSATLTGAQSVPPSGSNALGTARFDVLADGSIHWTLHTAGLDTVLASHIHVGHPGETGNVVVGLFTTGPSSNLDLQGSINDATQVAAVLNLFRTDDAYVNVHTTSFPNGEIRGRVVTSNGGFASQR